VSVRELSHKAREQAQAKTGRQKMHSSQIIENVGEDLRNGTYDETLIWNAINSLQNALVLMEKEGNL
jgi:hypothetical protein